MYTGYCNNLQLPVKVEHSCAAMDNASDLLTVVMGHKNALMVVMRLDVVSNHPRLAIIIAMTYCLYQVSSGQSIKLRLFSLICELEHTLISAICSSVAFRCNNGQCIRSSDRCDGTRDCTDGSDETTGCGELQLLCVWQAMY